MNLKEQTYICTLARWGTISRAAEELHLTAPALSMFLSTLEKNLDVRLFRRTGKTLEPTAIGREYIRIAEKMLLLKEEFDQALAREKNPKVRIVAAAIALETVAELDKCRKELDFAHTEVSCLTAAQGHPAGPYTLMQGQNPVYLFTFQGD